MPVNDTLILNDLLPTGVLLSVGRKITRCNAPFARMFGYEVEDLVDKSLEMLYPSRFEFIDRGDRWAAFMRTRGEHCDERIMLSRGDEPILIRVKGRCQTPRDPYLMMACTFEIVPTEQEGRQHLSGRELAIIEGMKQGLTSKEIARNLQLSPRTIETYRNRLRAKTGARNALHLISLLG